MSVLINNSSEIEKSETVLDRKGYLAQQKEQRFRKSKCFTFYLWLYLTPYICKDEEQGEDASFDCFEFRDQEKSFIICVMFLSFWLNMFNVMISILQTY